jgi:SRSO17 transposase
VWFGPLEGAMTASADARFSSYVDGLARVLGRAGRVGALRDYCSGLMLPLERKSVEPLAAVTAPARVSAQHQSLMHFVSQSAWSDAAMLAKVADLVLPTIEAHGPIEAWIIDDTAFRKQGRHSVGVARQYCGEIGKQENCQAAVSLSLANAWASLPVAFQLYLPGAWAADEPRRRKAGVPEDIAFATKGQIARAQIRMACEQGLPKGVVLMDAGYGHDARLRLDVTALDLRYVAGVMSHTLVFAPGHEPPADLKRPKSGNRRRHVVSVRDIARTLAEDAWRTIAWRDGTAEGLSSCFARVRVVSAHRHRTPAARHAEWLLIEWPEDQVEPTRFWLSTLDEAIGFERLVELTKLRWRIERDYQDLKQDLGLDHFEGRSWRGFHHHATLCIAAYGFLICERQTIPPSGPGRSAQEQDPALSRRRRPRGTPAATRTTYPKLDHNIAPAPDRRTPQNPPAMPMLRTALKTKSSSPIVTQ